MRLDRQGRVTKVDGEAGGGEAGGGEAGGGEAGGGEAGGGELRDEDSVC
jgi:hypothetical protein